MKILVTGGAGFIGSHVAKKLIEHGDEVVIVDNLNPYYDPILKRARLSALASTAEFHEIDIADRDSLEEIFKKHAFDSVCHLAAQAGVRYSMTDPFTYARSNYVGTLNVFELAKRYAVKNIVFASSSSVYGASSVMPFTEDDVCNVPLSVYASSKRAGELLAQTYVSLHGMDITCLRFFTVYGPWGRPDMALFSFTEKIERGESISLYNNGEMKRDFTYIDDIVDGFLSALKKPNGFQIFNLGRGEPVPLRTFVSVLEKTLGKTAVVEYKPMQDGEVAETFASVEKAKRILGFEARVSVAEGVPKFVEWYRQYNKKV